MIDFIIIIIIIIIIANWEWKNYFHFPGNADISSGWVSM